MLADAMFNVCQICVLSFIGQTSIVEYRALQKVLAEKNAQRDETLLQIKVLYYKVFFRSI